MVIQDPHLDGDTLTYGVELLDGTVATAPGTVRCSSTRSGVPCRRSPQPGCTGVSVGGCAEALTQSHGTHIFALASSAQRHYADVAHMGSQRPQIPLTSIVNRQAGFYPATSAGSNGRMKVRS